MPTHRQASCFLALLMLVLPAFASDPITEAAQALLARHTQGLDGEVLISVQPLQQAPVCDTADAFLPSPDHQSSTLARGGWVTVGVLCDGQTRYLRALVNVMSDYWVTAEDIEPGVTLAASQLRRERGDLSRLPTRLVRSADDAVGRQATRRLPAGTVLQPQQLRAVPVVMRRQRVTLEAAGTGFSIRREGEALDNGAPGEQVRVRLDAHTVVTAEVTGPGRLRVRH